LGRTLHEAMEAILREKSGKQEPRNIVLRALKYPEKFEVIVKLRDYTEQL